MGVFSLRLIVKNKVIPSDKFADEPAHAARMEYKTILTPLQPFGNYDIVTLHQTDDRRRGYGQARRDGRESLHLTD